MGLSCVPVVRSSAAFLFAIGLIIGQGEARGEDREVEVRKYVEALHSANRETRITALKEITTSGLTDRALFDFINALLLDGYRIYVGDAKGVDEMSWLCKALASSGIPDYRNTLGKVAAEAPSEKVRKYALQSLGLMESYAERNSLLVKQTTETQGLSPEVARLVNMLRAPDFKLKRDAAKMITRSSFKVPKLYDVVSEELLDGVKQGPLDDEHEDTLSWLCKALARSGDTARRTTLEQIYRSTDSGKLRKYAKESLDLLQ